MMMNQEVKEESHFYIKGRIKHVLLSSYSGHRLETISERISIDKENIEPIINSMITDGEVTKRVSRLNTTYYQMSDKLNNNYPCIVCGCPSNDIGILTMRSYCSIPCYESVLEDYTSQTKYDKSLDYFNGKMSQLSQPPTIIEYRHIKLDSFRVFHNAQLRTLRLNKMLSKSRAKGKLSEIIPMYAKYAAKILKADPKYIELIILNLRKQQYPYDLIPDKLVSEVMVPPELEWYNEIYRETRRIYEQSLGLMSGFSSERRNVLTILGDSPTPKVVF